MSVNEIRIINSLEITVFVYIALGAVFSIGYLLKGKRLSGSPIKTGTLGFSFIILPGLVLLWPFFFLGKKISSEKSEESSLSGIRLGQGPGLIIFALAAMAVIGVAVICRAPRIDTNPPYLTRGK